MSQDDRPEQSGCLRTIVLGDRVPQDDRPGEPGFIRTRGRLNDCPVVCRSVGMSCYGAILVMNVVVVQRSMSAWHTPTSHICMCVCVCVCVYVSVAGVDQFEWTR